LSGEDEENVNQVGGYSEGDWGDGAELRAIRDKFSHFRQLLDRNHQVLEIIGDMEEKSQGDYLFDLNFIRSRMAELREHVKEIIHCLVTLGGEQYEVLSERFTLIDDQIELVFPSNRPVREDAYCRRFASLSRMNSFSVGSKNAQLGEMTSRLGLPVPEGFAITAWAYKRFIDSNDLQTRISEKIGSVDIRSFSELARVSREIIDLINEAQVPSDLAEAIHEGARALSHEGDQPRFSLRSSAVGEDTLFSFAGQYASYLNVPLDQLIRRYREVVAGKFTPQAIYYFLSHSLSESELAMSVGCLTMIDAVAAGVVYSRDPVNPSDNDVLVSSVFGLGKFLVDGTLTPDNFRVTRRGTVIDSQIADKPVKLVMAEGGGTASREVPPEQRRKPSLNDKQLGQLARYAVLLEEHYDSPQDIEWAVDQKGRLSLLQTRPLQVQVLRPEAPLPDLSGAKRLVSGGTTVCHGAGCGKIHHVVSAEDLPAVPEGSVLVATNPFPGLVTVMNKIEALVTRVGGVASHMATIAREYRVPTLTGVVDALDLPQGEIATVDATGAVVYAGRLDRLLDARRPEYRLSAEESIFDILGRVLDLVSPLRLLNPHDEDFKVENCVTVHDITRYAHQKATEEMFLRATDISDKERAGLRLKTSLPVTVHLIYLDRKRRFSGRRGWVKEEEVHSAPMTAFWNGVKQEGWPTPGGGERSLTLTIKGREGRSFSEDSYAILSEEYMILSLRFGYHFATVETMCTESVNRNYIHLQFSHGGSTFDRRARRVRLITRVLREMGFECHSTGDYVGAVLSYKDAAAIAEKLTHLGRLTVMTKQLDMALSSDQVATWYTNDIMKRLGLSSTPMVKKGNDR